MQLVYYIGESALWTSNMTLTKGGDMNHFSLVVVGYTNLNTSACWVGYRCLKHQQPQTSEANAQAPN